MSHTKEAFEKFILSLIQLGELDAAPQIICENSTISLCKIDFWGKVEKSVLAISYRNEEEKLEIIQNMQDAIKYVFVLN